MSINPDKIIPMDRLSFLFPKPGAVFKVDCTISTQIIVNLLLNMILKEMCILMNGSAPK